MKSATMDTTRIPGHAQVVQVGHKRMDAARAYCTSFYDSLIDKLCDKADVLSKIEELTVMPRYVLATGELRQSSVAQKMAWAAGQTAIRRASYP